MRSGSVRIHQKIQKFKELVHPLLGHLIMTYSVSHRVQYCVGQNGRLTQESENRLSEILYDALGCLITTQEGMLVL